MPNKKSRLLNKDSTAKLSSIMNSSPGTALGKREVREHYILRFEKCCGFQDLLVRCGDREWKAHRTVLSARSDFFKRACIGRFVESSTREIEIEEEDPNAFHDFLMTLYTESCDWKDWEPLASDSGQAEEVDVARLPLTRAASVYVLGDKFDSPKVKACITSAVFEICDSDIWKAADWKLDDFSKAPEVIWPSLRFTNPRMKSFLLSLISRDRAGLLASARFEHALQGHSGLALDILKQFAEEERDLLKSVLSARDAHT